MLYASYSFFGYSRTGPLTGPRAGWFFRTGNHFSPQNKVPLKIHFFPSVSGLKGPRRRHGRVPAEAPGGAAAAVRGGVAAPKGRAAAGCIAHGDHEEPAEGEATSLGWGFRHFFLFGPELNPWARVFFESPSMFPFWILQSFEFQQETKTLFDRVSEPHSPFGILQKRSFQ